MDAIAARGLTKEYRHINKRTRRSLDALDLNVRAGEVYGFLGHNGAGKTTTIKMLCGLLKPTAGEAHLFGVSARKPEARQKLGYLPEQPYFYEYLTPRETIEMYARLRGLAAPARAAEWERLARLLDLATLADRPIKGFSKGMRQRIGFAVALVGDPPLLILDEPMSGLDPGGRRSIRELILRCRDEGKTLFFSSHVLGDVEQICNRVCILSEGKVIREGRMDELLGAAAYAAEVAVRGLDDTARAQAAEHADAHRRLEELDLFTAGSQEAGNALLRVVMEHRAEVVSYTPLKESLESYFMRANEASRTTETNL